MSNDACGNASLNETEYDSGATLYLRTDDGRCEGTSPFASAASLGESP
jgi:hypothetical protein